MFKLAVLALASALVLPGCGAPLADEAGQDATSERKSLMEAMFAQPPITRLYF